MNKQKQLSKADYVDMIVSNKNNKISREQLEKCSLKGLKVIYKMLCK